MEQDNKKKKKIIGISLGVVGALLLIFSGTYAYWQLTKEQSSANEIVAACLDFELSDVTEAISLERAYPISEAESEELTGYTFKVKNKCNDNIDYTIGLNSITNSSNNYLDNSSLRVKLDNGSSRIYETLNDIEYIENVRYSKELGTSTIQGNSENTHLLKVWVDENAPVTEQGKTFTGKIIITGSVGNTSSGEQIADSCFTIANDGMILSYDYACGTDVVVPAEVNGIQVKSISIISFNEGDIYSGYYYDELNDEDVEVVVIADKEHQDEIEESLLNDYLSSNYIYEAEGHNLSEFTTVYDSLEELLAVLRGKEYYLEVDVYNPVTGEINSSEHRVTKLNLSKAKYLQVINEYAFAGSRGFANNGECGSQTVGECGLGILEEIIFPTNGMLTTIGDNAFSENQLTSVTLPSSVNVIGGASFALNKLQDITIPEGIITIEAEAFYGNELTNLTIPSTVTSTGYAAFYDNKLQNVVIQEGVTSIDSESFKNNQLTRIVIPSSITNVGYNSFRDNPLVEVIIKRANADGMTIDSSAFNGITPTFNPNYTE